MFYFVFNINIQMRGVTFLVTAAQWCSVLLQLMFTVVPIEVFLKYWFNTLPQADQFISSSSSRYSYTSCERGQFQVFDHFWSLPFYLWLVSCTNNKGDWCIQTIQQEVYNFTRKCMNISRNLIKWIGQPEVMFWINIWGTLQLERQ
jgi:hypothetical protein